MTENVVEIPVWHINVIHVIWISNLGLTESLQLIPKSVPKAIPTKLSLKTAQTYLTLTETHNDLRVS